MEKIKKIYRYIQKKPILKEVSYWIFSELRSILSKFLFRAGDIHILHIGQVHSVHFKKLDGKVKEIYAAKKIRQTSTLICTYPAPIVEAMKNYKIIDIFDNPFLWTIPVDEFQKKLYLNNEVISKSLIKIINKSIKNDKPNIIWIHDLQAGGYPLLMMDMRILSNIKIICTTYGNDIYHYWNSPWHRGKIEKMFEFVDCFQVESVRDADILKLAGYKGIVTKPMSATFRNYEPYTLLNHDKDIDIILKGSAFLRSSSSDIFYLLINNSIFFKSKKILIFNATQEDKFWFGKLKAYGFERIEIMGQLSQFDLNKLFERSKFHLTFTYSDGMSNTCVEAVAAKCIPIISPHNSFAELLCSKYAEKNINQIPINPEKLIAAIEFYEDLAHRNEFFEYIDARLIEYFSQKKYEKFFDELGI